MELPPLLIEIPFSYYVLERAESDVEQIIEEGKADTEALLLIFKQMCKAVQRIHSRSIVHRDLRPGNFLTMSDQTIRLSDFGAAREVGEKAGAILTDYAGLPPGDIRYTALEMIASLHDVNPAFAFKADIFSLGAILFELFTRTILVDQLFDLQFQRKLLTAMATVPRNDRHDVYDGFASEMADAHPLPTISDYSPTARRCVLPLVNDLYKSMAALDYKKRTGNFEYVFLKIDQALIVLRNEDKLKKWRERRELYRQNLELKRERMRADLGATVGEQS